jgi:two-component system cell cycle response regulator
MTRDKDDSGDDWITQTVVQRADGRLSSAAAGDCLVIIYSKDTTNLGKRFVLEETAPPVSVGRGTDNVVVLPAEGVSRRHARFERRDGQWLIVDLGSTNGTYVNDEPVTEHRLRRGDHVKIGDSIFKYLSGSDVEAAYHEEIYRMTIVDGLTQAHNRRFFFESLDREISRARRYHRPLGLVMLDIDHFSKVNNTFGHLAGDYVLREISNLVRARIRRDEIFARYGGEEFGIILPETDLRGTHHVAESIRAIISAHPFVFEREQIAVTASLGVAELDDAISTPEAFIQLADERLYRAKHGGRNRVVAE